MCSFFLLLFLLTDHNFAYEHSCIVAIEITFLWMLIYFLLLFFISGFLFVCLLFCFIGQALNRQSGLVSNSQPYCRNYPLPCRIAYKQINDGCDHSNISHWFSFFSSTMRPLWFLSEVTNPYSTFVWELLLPLFSPSLQLNSLLLGGFCRLFGSDI